MYNNAARRKANANRNARRSRAQTILTKPRAQRTHANLATAALLVAGMNTDLKQLRSRYLAFSKMRAGADLQQRRSVDLATKKYKAIIDEVSDMHARLRQLIHDFSSSPRSPSSPPRGPGTPNQPPRMGFRR
jgi:hypothetical protein